MWTGPGSYPDERIEFIKPEFRDLIMFNASVERLATGMRWCEGPVWFGDMRSVMWSDIPNNRMMRWDEMTGEVGTFRSPSNFANGNTRDQFGRLVTCEHGTRRVTRTEHDGSITVLADAFEGKRLNSPNDIVVKSDGTIWFTDPPFGIMSDYEGGIADQEIPARIYRLDVESRKLSIAAEDANFPNGLAFSPDERQLFVVESRGKPNRGIRAYDLNEAGDKLTNGRKFIDAGENGTPDGFRVDVYGNIWAGWGMSPLLNGVRVFGKDGEPIGHIHLPERCANLCFAGVRRNRLFMAAGQSVYSLYVNTRGIW